MCLNNFSHDHSIVLMPHTFGGFTDLCMKAHDTEIHLNKDNKNAKESSSKTGRLVAAAIAPGERAQYSASSSSSKKPYLKKLRVANKGDPVVAQVPKCTQIKKQGETPFAPRTTS